MNDKQALVAIQMAKDGFGAREIAEAMGLEGDAVKALLAQQAPGTPPEAGPLRAILFADRRAHRASALRGSIWIAPCDEGGETALWFVCPCGCGQVCRVIVGHRHKPAAHGATWRWNGSMTEPTLHPSVNVPRAAACAGWHGWLRDGYWEVA